MKKWIDRYNTWGGAIGTTATLAATWSSVLGFLGWLALTVWAFAGYATQWGYLPVTCISLFVAVNVAYLMMAIRSQSGRPRVETVGNTSKAAHRVEHALMLSFAARRIDLRKRTEKLGEKTFTTVPLRLTNTSSRRITDIQLTIQVRTVEGPFIASEHDTPRIHVDNRRIARDLNAGDHHDYVVASLSEGDLWWGDPTLTGAVSEKRRGWHYMTVTVTSSEPSPRVANVILRTGKSYLEVIEFDARQWASHENAPSLFSDYPQWRGL